MQELLRIKGILEDNLIQVRLDCSGGFKSDMLEAQGRKKAIEDVLGLINHDLYIVMSCLLYTSDAADE